MNESEASAYAIGTALAAGGEIMRDAAAAFRQASADLREALIAAALNAPPGMLYARLRLRLLPSRRCCRSAAAAGRISRRAASSATST